MTNNDEILFFFFKKDNLFSYNIFLLHAQTHFSLSSHLFFSLTQITHIEGGATFPFPFPFPLCPPLLFPFSLFLSPPPPTLSLRKSFRSAQGPPHCAFRSWSDQCSFVYQDRSSISPSHNPSLVHFLFFVFVFIIFLTWFCFCFST